MIGTTPARLHVIEGPVGSGKTTFARKLGRECASPPLILDDWMATLFRPDKPDLDLWPWYAERKLRCEDQILKIAFGLLGCGHDAIVELGLLKRAARERLYARVDKTPFDCRIYILDAPVEERWERVQNRNVEQGDTFTMEVSEEVFRLASDLWEPPDEAERAGRDMRFLT